MKGITLLVITILCFLVAYVTYGSWLAKQWDIDPKRKTPAHDFEDGVDYIPAKAPVLLGHHFASIAGAGPINYWQAAGLMVLTRLLFGGPWHHFGFMGNRNVNWRKEHRRFHERMGHVSLEEKKAFIRRWMNGFNEEKE